MTVFTSYFLRKVSGVVGESFLAVTTFVQKELVHSLVEHLQTPMNKRNKGNTNYLKNSQKSSRTVQNAETCVKLSLFQNNDLSYSYGIPHRVKCRAEAVNYLSRCPETHKMLKIVLSKLEFIKKISETVTPHKTLFQHKIGYVQHLT